MSLLGGIVKDVLPGPLLGDSEPATGLLQGVKNVLPIPLQGDSQPTPTAAAAAAAAPKQTSTTSTASVSTPPPTTSSAPAPEPTTVTSKSSSLSSSTQTVSTSTLSTSSVPPGSHAESATGVRSMTKSDAHGLPHTFSSSSSPARSTSAATSAKTQSGSSSHSSMSTGFIIFLACAGFILLWILVMGMVLRRRRHRINSERSREVQTQMSGMVGFGKLDDDDGPPSPPILIQRPRKNTLDWMEESNEFQFVQPHGVIDPTMYHSNSRYDEKHSDLGNFSRVEMMGMQEYPPPPPPPKMYHEHEIGMGMQPQHNNQMGVAIGNTSPMYIPDVGLERAMGAQANRGYPDPNEHFQDQSTIRADQRDSSFPESMSHETHWNQPEPSSWATQELSFPQTPSAVHSSHLDVSSNQRFSTGLGYLYPIHDSISEHSGSQESGATRTSMSESEATHQSESFSHILPSFTPVELSSGLVDRPDYIRSRSASEDTIGPSIMPLPGGAR